jgi:cell fate (sporulation/competence/biofilm development) regulator YlbF (YheA/YmcA/DUF963 family)
VDDRPTGAHRADIMHLAQRLGEHLRECEPVRQYQEAVQRVDADPSAAALLAKFETRRAELREWQRHGQALTDAQLDELIRLQAAVEEQPTLFALLSAATVARRFLQEINRDLSARLDVDFAELACGEREHDRA